MAYIYILLGEGVSGMRHIIQTNGKMITKSALQHFIKREIVYEVVKRRGYDYV